VEALRAALSNPLLDLEITGARALLVNITGGPDLMIHEVSEVVEALRQQAHPGANVLFGTVEDPALEGQLKVTVVAAGFEPRVDAMSAQAARYAPSGRTRAASWPAADTPRVRTETDATHPYVPAAPAWPRPAGDQSPDNRPARQPSAANGSQRGVSRAASGQDNLGELEDLDGPRAGPARMEPASAVPARAASGRGLDTPGFWRRRRG
jgi:hypothetical protein